MASVRERRGKAGFGRGWILQSCHVVGVPESCSVLRLACMQMSWIQTSRRRVAVEMDGESIKTLKLVAYHKSVLNRVASSTSPCTLHGASRLQHSHASIRLCHLVIHTCIQGNTNLFDNLAFRPYQRDWGAEGVPQIHALLDTNDLQHEVESNGQVHMWYMPVGSCCRHNGVRFPK